MRTSRAKRTTRAGRQRVGTKKARSNRGTRETRARKTRGSRSRKSADKQLSETLSLPEELIETLSSVLQGPKKSVKGKRPVIEMETSSEPAKKSKTKKKSKKKKSKKPKAWHSKIHGKKSKKGKKKKHKKKMKGGALGLKGDHEKKTALARDIEGLIRGGMTDQAVSQHPKYKQFLELIDQSSEEIKGRMASSNPGRF